MDRIVTCNCGANQWTLSMVDINKANQHLEATCNNCFITCCFLTGHIKVHTALKELKGTLALLQEKLSEEPGSIPA